MEGQIVEDPVLRQRYRFSHSVDPDGGAVLHVETWVDPRGGVTPHVHPAMEERFTSWRAARACSRAARGREAGPGDDDRRPRRAPPRLPQRGRRAARTCAPTSARRRRCRRSSRRSPSCPRPGRSRASGCRAEPARSRRAGDRPAPPRHGHAAVPAVPPPLVQRLLFPPLARLAGAAASAPGGFARAERPSGAHGAGRRRPPAKSAASRA